jgi:TolB-like protein/DNA-binding winged helix-turn-helix (wHTH) protein
LNAPYRFRRFELDPATRQLLTDGVAVTLGVRAFDVLLALVERRDRTVTKDELMEIAWPGVVVEENNLQVQISALRKVLGPQAIATIPGRGYRFTLRLAGDSPVAAERASDAVERRDEPISPVLPAEKTESAQRVSAVSPSKRWLAGAVAAFAVIAMAGGWYWSRPPVPANAVMPKLEARAAGAKSIAVLPFTNMSEDKGTAYFADGVHEDLLTQLALLGDVQVVSRTSVMEYRDSKKNARQIGAELGVASLVEGSVRRAGNHVRVTAQLVDARTDKHVWAKSYDRELKDIFAIQSELATEIARALNVSLTPQDQTRLAKRPTDNLEAYDLFLRHQELVNQSTATLRIMSTVKQRIALLSQAVELDPKFALAWARLAAEHAWAYGYGIDRNADRLKQAGEAMKRAQALAPADMQIEIEAGNYYLRALKDVERAAASFQKVLSVAPNNMAGLSGLSRVYDGQFRDGDAVVALERAHAVDARNMEALILLSNHYLKHRQYDRALALRQQLVNLRPDDVALQARYQQVEYWRSGSWDAYDRWRSTIPKDAVLKTSRLRFVDIDRAAARRDFTEVLRLMALESEDIASLMDSSAAAERSADRAAALRAKSDLAQAKDAGRETLRLIENEFRRTSDNLALWIAKARMHALLGERKLAFSAHASAVALGEKTYGNQPADFTYRQILQVHALLGDRAEALAELGRQLKLPNSCPYAFPVDIDLVSLWDDPQFQALVNDPKNNAPLPIVNREPPQLGEMIRAAALRVVAYNDTSRDATWRLPIARCSSGHGHEFSNCHSCCASIRARSAASNARSGNASWSHCVCARPSPSRSQARNSAPRAGAAPSRRQVLSLAAITAQPFTRSARLLPIAPPCTQMSPPLR